MLKSSTVISIFMFAYAGVCGGQDVSDRFERMSAMNADIADAGFPPLSPVGEMAAPSNPVFVRSCLSALDHIAALGDIRPGVQRLTTNQTWGLVFRADFTINQSDQPGLINRLICWRQPNGQVGSTYAIGQAVPPLTSN